MSATVMSDPMMVSAVPAPETQVSAAVVTIAAAAAAQVEVEFAKCDCCGLTEECTPAYIEHVRERYHGKWVCGLCAEAVKDEIVRTEDRLISTEEAMSRHMNFCKKFMSSGRPPPDPTVHLISAMRQILRRSLDSPRGGLRSNSTPTSPVRKGRGEIRRPGFTRSESCFSTLSR